VRVAWVLVQPSTQLGDLLDQRGNLFGQGDLTVPQRRVLLDQHHVGPVPLGQPGAQLSQLRA
jgi:hypothetical protein